MKTNIRINDSNRQAVANELAKLLADEYVLYTKTRNAHWNIESTDFYDKHRFFEKQYEQLDGIIDDVAERIRTLGHYASGTLKSFLELTHLTEMKGDKNDDDTFLRQLLSDHESIIIHLRENIHRFGSDFKDFGTSDFITGLMEVHEKMAWFLRSHIVVEEHASNGSVKSTGKHDNKMEGKHDGKFMVNLAAKGKKNNNN